MKVYRGVLSVVILGLLTSQLCGKTEVTLQNALIKKYITAKAVCKGGLQLNYAVTNLLKDSLSILIPAGWRFNSDAGKNDYQDIFMAHEQVLALSSKQTKHFDINGYCCEITKMGPVKGAPYTLGKMADSNLVKLARYLNAHPTGDANMEQYSVWAISDRRETAHITGNDSTAVPLRTIVAGIKNEPLPWYTLFKKARILDDGTVSDLPFRFKADFSFMVSKTCYSYCYLVDSTGKQVSEVYGKWLYPGNQNYNESFNVAGLKNGDYKILVRSSDVSVFEKAFKI